MCDTDEATEFYSEAQPDGFPDGEGEGPIQALVDNAQEYGYYTGDPRESQNERYEAIREAATWIYEVIDTHPVGDGPVGTAIKDIKYKLWWVSTTGQGMEDIT